MAHKRKFDKNLQTVRQIYSKTLKRKLASFRFFLPNQKTNSRTANIMWSFGCLVNQMPK